MADGVRKDEEFSGTREVEERHRVNEASLDAWMKQHVEGYQGPLKVLQFKGGQSNPTYELVTPTAAYVLRRKPPGVLLPSAHAVDREFQVISALAAQGFPVAKPHALCLDESVIGSIFATIYAKITRIAPEKASELSTAILCIGERIEHRLVQLPGLDPS